MLILRIVLSAFLVLETLNVLILYFQPQSLRGNGIGIFKAFEKSRDIPAVRHLVKYLINWIAGTKLIFIALIIVILIKGDQMLLALSVGFLSLSILTFFWRLYPSLKKMDEDNELVLKGYSKTLGIMISSFLIFFSLALILTAIIYK